VSITFSRTFPHCAVRITPPIILTQSVMLLSYIKHKKTTTLKKAEFKNLKMLLAGYLYIIEGETLGQMSGFCNKKLWLSLILIINSFHTNELKINIGLTLNMNRKGERVGAIQMHNYNENTYCSSRSSHH
jgi:hypothetical protein